MFHHVLFVYLFIFFNHAVNDCRMKLNISPLVCRVALPQPPADFFNLGAGNTTSEGAPSSESQPSGQPPPPVPVSSPASPGYRLPPMPMFRPPVGMIPPHLAMGPGGPRRPPPPPPRMHGPLPGRPFPPGRSYDFDVFRVCLLVI